MRISRNQFLIWAVTNNHRKQFSVANKRRRLRYAGRVPNPQKCLVTIQTGNDILRSTEVTAGTVYEAACLALRAFTDDALDHHKPNQDIHPSHDLVIDVQPIPVRHRVRVAELVNYLNSLGRPRDSSEKIRLREIVKGWKG